MLVTRLFKPGHDAKMHRIAREYVRGERELTDEQRQYVEQSGNRVLARVEEPERLSEGGSGGFTGAPDMSHEPRPEERCGES